MKSDLNILSKLPGPEVTTSILLAILSGYKDPRRKLVGLVNKGIFEPIKQGVYLASPKLGLRPYSKEILANLIYGPSYISLESALQHYGFIPEQVFTTTSVCLGRGRSFSTPVGEFEYHHVKSLIYPAGVMIKEIGPNAYYHIATGEKAMLDFIYIRESKGDFKNSKEYFNYLVESYRFDLDQIQKQISLKKLKEFSELYPYAFVKWFADELINRMLR